MEGSQMPEPQVFVVEMLTLSSVADAPAALMLTPYPLLALSVALLIAAEPPLYP
ncbi:hypothetical protein D3C86_2150170 [compost metagenome]